jgi:hypothetical protein
MKSESFIGLINTSDKGLVPTEMTVVNMEDLREANRTSGMYAGFKIVYGRTESGEVFDFMKSGQWAKRDFMKLKEMGVIELVCHGCFAPTTFDIPQGRVKLSKTFECGRETKERLDRYARTLGYM